MTEVYMDVVDVGEVYVTDVELPAVAVEEVDKLDVG